MKREDFYNVPKYAGIYYFKNNINGKYYIGQATKLRSKLLAHINNYEHKNYDAPIYRAFTKYGIENFSWGVLDTFRDALSKETKDKLNSLEIKYIKEYNSYVNNGYNTIIAEGTEILNSEEPSNEIGERNPKNWVKARNIITKCEKIAISKSYLAKSLGVPNSIIDKAFIGEVELIKNQWVVSKYCEPYKENKQ